MVSETEHTHPPNGLVGLCVYNATDKKWYIVRGSDDGTLDIAVASLPLPSGAATSAKQLADGHNVTVDNTDLEVFQDTPGGLLMGQHQYDGSDWRKSNLLWGYYDRWVEQQTVAGTGSGWHNAQTVAVDEGYIHVVQMISIFHNDPAARDCRTIVSAGGVSVYTDYTLAADANIPVISPYTVTMKKDDFVQAGWEDLASGKTGYLRLLGYKMKIDM